MHIFTSHSSLHKSRRALLSFLQLNCLSFPCILSSPFQTKLFCFSQPYFFPRTDSSTHLSSQFIPGEFLAMGYQDQLGRGGREVLSEECWGRSGIHSFHIHLQKTVQEKKTFDPAQENAQPAVKSGIRHRSSSDAFIVTYLSIKVAPVILQNTEITPTSWTSTAHSNCFQLAARPNFILQ